MKINIQVENRKNARNVVMPGRFSVISVYTPNDVRNDFFNLPENILYLRFSDADPSKLDCFDNIELFDKSMAREIIDFVKKEIENGVDNFLVHCDAGISRSPGIAVALNEIFNNIKKVPKAWCLYNKFIYKTIIKEWYGCDY